MEQERKHESSDVAFALAGLGGFNAHGAGFLAAATEAGVTPDIVTATSGQIFVLSEWIKGRDMRAVVVAPEAERDRFAQARVALTGLRGVFAPAYAEAVGRWFRPPAPHETEFETIFDRLLPAQQYVPTRPDAWFADVAATLQNAPFGVVFNAYDLARGKGVLYGNDRARAQLPEKSAIAAPSAVADLRSDKTAGGETRLEEITPEAVKAALWLSLYGFDGLVNGQIDGAYHRSCIVSELRRSRFVFVARPLANGWIEHDPPRNWFDVQDWQCEMWFSASYKAEIQGMDRINRLIADGVLEPGKPFRHVEIVEIAPSTPAGYFNFFIERPEVFEAARTQAAARFAELKPRLASPD